MKITGPFEAINGLGPVRYVLNRPLGPELVNDGAFSAACGVNWTCNAPWTIGSGKGTIDGSQVAATNLFQANSITQGSTYYVVFTTSGVTAGSMHYASGTTTGQDADANGTWKQAVYQDQVTGGNIINQADADFAGSVDDVSVRKVF